MRKFLNFLGIVGLLVVAGCRVAYASVPGEKGTPKVFILEKAQTDYRLQGHIQVLQDTLPGYTIQEIIQPSLQNRFRVHQESTTTSKNYQYYWGKVQVENRLADAGQYTEWVLEFNSTWTSLDVFTKGKDGSWRQDQNGTFTPDYLKNFVPTAKGNLVKVLLPPHEVVTIYFRGISERTAINPSFSTRLRHIETFYDALLKTKVSNAVFIGFLLMMFLYNLIVYFFGRDRSFIFYSGYLLMVVTYAAYSSDDLVDWLGLFPHHPAYQGFTKLSLYLAIMCYLAFLRSFLDLEQLLPTFDTVFKAVIYLGFPLIVLDITVLLLTNFSYVVEDRITVPYIILVIIICCLLVYPLSKTKDKKGYFAIAGIAAICLGAVITVVTRVWVPPFSIFYLKAGTVVETLIFSLGLAYRQRQQKQAQQQADYKLKESQLIQERKQVEADRFKELNEFKTRFYTNITHEFRTPLTVIMGMSENINNHEKEKELIRRNGQNLLRLINQMLDLSKLESGTLTLTKVNSDIIGYLQYLTESFYSSATLKNIRLVFHSDEKAVMMDYDEEKIQQIVYNLLSNALKYTRDYGQIIFHAAEIEENGVPFLKLKVKDNGIGIPEEEINFIFDRFFQADHVVSNKEGGTGIGLALTKELVELMKGRIEVRSQVGKGTEFTLYLPIETQVGFISPTGRTDDALAETEEADRSDLPIVLILEDNQDIILYIKSILKDDYKIHTAGDGALGIEKALEIIPDIIISDVMMPKKNGYEVCTTLKQDERTSHIPIILLSAKATQADRLDGLKYGADAYLTKPFDKEELRILLKKLVDIRQKLLLRYGTSAPAQQATVTSLEEIFLQKLREHLQAHLSDAEFGVAELASAVPMSQIQLYRKLKALTGKTPSQFIRTYRLQKGLELLQKDELNVSEIAYEVGFADPSYFSRVFQKEFGKSPSIFMK